ncbi:MAG: PorT family protein [Tannerella sp.]|nr:PorT family protein [Tannerella sp.]
MKMKYATRAVMIGLCVLSLIRLQAQEKRPGWDFRINGGFNIGGTSPLPLPPEIRTISFSPPALSPHAALEVIRRWNDRWGLSLQIAFDYKGFEVNDRVKNLYTEIEMNSEKYTGNFTGKNTTRIHNSFLTLPLAATCRIGNRWEVQAGMYAGYLYSAGFKGTASDGYIRRNGPVGEKTMVDRASFDFSDRQRSFDYGLLLAGEWGFSRRFAARGQVAWGLNPVFPSDFTGIPFKMYHIYGTLGLSYHLNTR